MDGSQALTASVVESLAAGPPPALRDFPIAGAAGRDSCSRRPPDGPSEGSDVSAGVPAGWLPVRDGCGEPGVRAGAWPRDPEGPGVRAGTLPPGPEGPGVPAGTLPPGPEEPGMPAGVWISGPVAGGPATTGVRPGPGVADPGRAEALVSPAGLPTGCRTPAVAGTAGLPTGCPTPTFAGTAGPAGLPASAPRATPEPPGRLPGWVSDCALG
jgi:hypothetical protein